MSADFWFLDHEHNQCGPVPKDEIIKLIRDGTIGRETQVWAEGMNEWQMVSNVEGFSSLFGPRLSPPSPPPIQKIKPSGIRLKSGKEIVHTIKWRIISYVVMAIVIVPVTFIFLYVKDTYFSNSPMYEAKVYSLLEECIAASTANIDSYELQLDHARHEVEEKEITESDKLNGMSFNAKIRVIMPERSKVQGNDQGWNDVAFNFFAETSNDILKITQGSSAWPNWDCESRHGLSISESKLDAIREQQKADAERQVKRKRDADAQVTAAEAAQQAIIDRYGDRAWQGPVSNFEQRFTELLVKYGPAYDIDPALYHQEIDYIVRMARRCAAMTIHAKLDQDFTECGDGFPIDISKKVGKDANENVRRLMVLSRGFANLLNGTGGYFIEVVASQKKDDTNPARSMRDIFPRYGIMHAQFPAPS